MPFKLVCQSASGTERLEHSRRMQVKSPHCKISPVNIAPMVMKKLI
jgi:hypothetical protein